MKTVDYGDEFASPEIVNRVASLVDVDETNFVLLARRLTLDPAHDFQNGDLRDVDFSDCNLDGFDFSGADLRGATGVNVTGKPVLEGADVSDSLFEYQVGQERYFADNPDDRETVDRIAAEYWANAILSVERLIQSRADGSGTKIAAAIFDKTKDSTVRTNILLFMRLSSESSQDHKSFIGNMLAKHSDDISVLLAGVRALTAFYASHRDGFRWLLKFLNHKNPLVRSAAFRGVVNSKRLPEAIPDVVKYVLSTTQPEHRRAFVGRVSRLLGLKYARAAFDYRENRFIDFREEITMETLRKCDPDDYQKFSDQQQSELKAEIIRQLYERRRLAHLEAISRQYGFSFCYDKAVLQFLARST